MAVQLRAIPITDFRDSLKAALSSPVSDSLAATLFVHYEELRRWATRTSLVGPSETERIVERHYAESLLALSLVDGAARILDLGSGAGFPGWVLAAAVPTSTFWLVESRQRKAAFLRSAAARAQLSCRIVGARVSRRHPVTNLLGSDGQSVGPIDLVTVRAVKMTEDIWGGLWPGLAAGARVLRWEGAQAVEPIPGATAGRTSELPGLQRRIQEWLLPLGNHTG